MSETIDTRAAARALREGLEALPAPHASPGFDGRVLGALRTASPWWMDRLPCLRPAAGAAVASLVLTLLLARWALLQPAAPRVGAPAVAENGISLDALLDQPRLSALPLFRLCGTSALCSEGAP